ncbi:MAG: hypothetical protein WC499_03420 [Patescibacteria group bacterium]
MEQNIDELKKNIEDIIIADDLVGAGNLSSQINQWLKENEALSQTDPATYQEYKSLLVKLSFVLLNTLRDERIINLFKNNFTQAFEMEDFDPLNDIIRKLKVILISKFAFEKRDELKKDIMEALLENQQPFLELKEGLQEKSISGWLGGYMSAVGTEPVDNKIKIVEYLNKISAENQLTNGQKEKLLKLFDLFEFLKTPSFSPKGLEEKVTVVDEKGQFKIYDQGREIILNKTKVAKSLTSEEKENDEIEKIKKQQAAVVPIDINQAVETAITKVGLTFPDEILEKRFKNVVFSYLREVRGEIETRIVLKRPQKIGGVELDETTVDKVMDILKQEKPMIKIEPMGNIPQIELAEGLKQPEETISKFTRMEKPEEKIVPEIKPVSLLPKIEEEKLLIQPEETKEKLLKEKFEQGPLGTPTYADKDTDLRGQEETRIYTDKKIQPVMPEFKPIIPPILEKKIEEPSFAKATEDKKKESNLFTAVSEEQKTDSSAKTLEKEEISGPEEITDVLKELDQLPVGDAPFVLDEDAEDKFKLPIKELPKEEPKPTETRTYAEKDTDLRRQGEIRTKETLPIIPPVLEKKFEEEKEEIKKSQVEPIFIHRPPREPAMSKMEEIKVTPRVSGPIEELQGITLQDWRRWGNPEQAVQKIKEKIDLLGEESLVKKSEGIKAWKESEINKLYLDIGSESIDKGISVSEVIALRQKENRKTLDEEEFDKVVELNQNLRF